MKYYIQSILILLIIGTVISSSTENETACMNTCGVCQQAVYQLKFQGLADCGGNTLCKNTCYQINEKWKEANSIFQPFEKDIFGKCEICFRAGYCGIAECKAQQDQEADEIAHLVNTFKLTAKKNNLLQDIELNSSEKSVKTDEQIKKLDVEINYEKEIIDKKIDITFDKNVETVPAGSESASKAINEVGKIVDEIFGEASVLNAAPVEKVEAEQIAVEKSDDAVAQIQKGKKSIDDLIKVSEDYLKHVEKVTDLVDKVLKTENKENKEKATNLVDTTVANLEKNIESNNEAIKEAKNEEDLKEKANELKKVTKRMRKAKTKLSR